MFNYTIIKQKREILGYSRYDLAKMSNVHPSTIFQIESGRTPNVGVITVMKIMKALGLSFKDLFVL